MKGAAVSLPFVAFLVCFFAFAMRVTAMANKEITAGRPFKLTFWKVFYQAVASFGIGFLAWSILLEKELGNGLKIGILFGISFTSTVMVDALLLISPRMVLREFAAWLATKTGNASPPPYEPPADTVYPPQNLPENGSEPSSETEAD